jgi:hypothetical protein
MSLSLEQKYRVLRAVKGIASELGIILEYPDMLAEYRADYGPEVVELLAGVISVAEWQSTRDWVVSRRDLLIARAKAKLGDDLGALRQ